MSTLKLADHSTGVHSDYVEDILRISKAEIPPRKLSSVLKHFKGQPQSLLHADPAQLYEHRLNENQVARLTKCAKMDVSADLQKLADLNARIVHWSDPSYPPLLKQLPDAPPFLFVRGTLEADDQFSVAIVGSRRATAYGLSIAECFAREMAGFGLRVVSGGARGVDTLAHKGALSAGGRTIAVIGTGIDVTYPSENRRLFDDIAGSGKGAIISEYPLGTMPEPWRFPERNRLIAGITLGTLVIESPVGSGALITAYDAVDFGREVFAVPGPIETGFSSGCHKLIQQGAKLVASVDDILDELGILRLTEDAPNKSSLLRPAPDIEPQQRCVLDRLSLQARHVDQLSAECALPPATVIGILTMLELRGLARRVPGNAFVRVL